MTKLSQKQIKILEAARKQGQALIQACNDLESGKIDAEEFEKRATKAILPISIAGPSGGGIAHQI